MRAWRPVAVAVILGAMTLQPGFAQGTAGPGGRGGGGPGGPSSSGPAGGQGAGSPPGSRSVPGAGLPPGSREADAVRDAVNSGRAVPYPRVLAAVAARVEGMVVDVDLREAPAGGLLYDVKVLTPEGVLREVEVEAAHGIVQAVR